MLRAGAGGGRLRGRRSVRRAGRAEGGEARPRLGLDRRDGRCRLGRPGLRLELRRSARPVRRSRVRSSAMYDERSRLRTRELVGARGRVGAQPGEPRGLPVQRAEHAADLASRACVVCAITSFVEVAVRFRLSRPVMISSSDVAPKMTASDVGAVLLVEGANLLSEPLLRDARATAARPAAGRGRRRGRGVPRRAPPRRRRAAAGPVEARVQRVELEQRRLLARLRARRERRGAARLDLRRSSPASASSTRRSRLSVSRPTIRVGARKAARRYHRKRPS